MGVKSLIQGILRPFGYQFVRLKRAAPAAKPAAGKFEIGMHRALGGLVARGFIPTAVVDVGAAHGHWTREALTYWPAARYTLIEPLAEYRPELEALTHAHSNVSFVLAGAGREPGSLAVGVQADLVGSSFLYPGDEQRTVPIVTLDSLIAGGQMPPPQFIKLDVQGYELDVLEGAGAALASCEALLLELNFHRFSPGMPLMHEVVAWLVAHGFRPYEIVGVLRRPLDGAMGQCDLLFVREGHRLLSNSEWG